LKTAIQKAKLSLASTVSILSIEIECDRVTCSISLSQPKQFGMMECNPMLTPIKENQKLSSRMSPDMPERQVEMKAW